MEGHKVFHAPLVEEPTPASQLIVGDATGELEQTVAAEAVRFQDLLGCAHSLGVYRRATSE
jgi:hypothetical protein